MKTIFFQIRIHKAKLGRRLIIDIILIFFRSQRMGYKKEENYLLCHPVRELCPNGIAPMELPQWNCPNGIAPMELPQRKSE